MLDAIAMLSLPFLVCLAIVAIVGYAGLHVLKREVIFIDIALAQVAAVGVIVPHIAFHTHHDSALTYVFPLLFTTGAAAFYALVRRRVSQIPLEAIIGVSYAIAAGAALFLIGVTPGGHVHVKHMLIGSILWVKWSDLAACAVTFSAAGLCFYLMRKPFGRISDDYEAAVRQGLRVALWDFWFYALLGVVIILAVRLAGVVVVFCFLIIPATTSAVFSSRWGVRLVLTWAFGAAAAALGLVFAYCLDFSLGPSVAAWSGLLLVVSALTYSRGRPHLFVTAMAVLLVALTGLVLWSRPASSRGLARDAQAPRTGVAPTRAACAPQWATELTDEAISALAAQARDAQRLAALFAKAQSAQTRSEIVCRALELDRRVGARLLLDFLERDPPLFFRATAVASLDDALGERMGLDASQSFASPANQQAAAKLEQRLNLAKPGEPQ